MAAEVPSRIGVLTGGGDAPGLNAVIRGVVKAADARGWSVLGFEQGYEGLLPPQHFRILDRHNTQGILHVGGTILGTVNRGHFSSRTGVGRERRVAPEIIAAACRTCAECELLGLICIGGDGSLAIANELHQHGVPVVGVPKTIDNDLEGTSVTFGFDSAVAFATEALDRLHTTAASHERVIVMEVMGRYAGWIAIEAGIAGGAEVILIPEIPWTLEPILGKIREREASGRPFVLIVVAEGARWPDGQLVTDRPGMGGAGEVHLGGIGERLARELETLSNRDTRFVVLGHLQRGGPPTNRDRLLATRFGVNAVRLVAEGRFGRMVSYDPPEIHDVPLEDVVHRTKCVPVDGDLVRTARALGICLGDG